jgi:hypothetical protein
MKKFVELASENIFSLDLDNKNARFLVVSGKKNISFTINAMSAAQKNAVLAKMKTTKFPISAKAERKLDKVFA